MPARVLPRGPSVPSAVGLVIANVVPVVGVIWLGWDLSEIMSLYWAESGVIGAFTVFRMLTAGEPIRWWTALFRLFPAAFFVVHYGGFWAIHGLFVLTLFSTGAEGSVGGPLEGVSVLLDLVPPEAAALLVVSHGLSFVLNYLAGGEWRAADPISEMGKPYGRVVVLHLVLLLGGFLLLPSGGARWALSVLVIVKTALDLGIHLAAHKKRLAEAAEAARSAEAPEASGAARAVAA